MEFRELEFPNIAPGVLDLDAVDVAVPERPFEGVSGLSCRLKKEGIRRVVGIQDERELAHYAFVRSPTIAQRHPSLLQPDVTHRSPAVADVEDNESKHRLARAEDPIRLDIKTRATQELVPNEYAERSKRNGESHPCDHEKKLDALTDGIGRAKGFDIRAAGDHWEHPAV